LSNAGGLLGQAPASVDPENRSYPLGRLEENSPELAYCQVVPLEKWLRPQSLVGFKLNGRFLPRRNGFPARALFPRFAQ
jgi:DMSO/TMAO reductase YedYZ molybdopterin-dependent catalytic subunit